jgi:surface antigen
LNENRKVIKWIFATMLLMTIVMSLFASSAVAYPSSTKIPIGNFCGVMAYSNGPMYADTATGNGYWQCVEYVKRFYLNAMGVDSSGWHGSAWTYYDSAPGWGLNSYQNNGFVPPMPGDIFVYNKGSTTGNQYGHVAIVTAVRSNSIDVIEQNVNPTNGFRTITRSGNSFPDWSGMSVRGWAHKGPLVAVTSPSGGNYWTRLSNQRIQWQYRTDLGMTYAKIDLVSTSGSIIPVVSCVSLTGTGTGSYSMTVTQPSGQYRARVTLFVGSGPQYSATSSVFYIG